MLRKIVKELRAKLLIEDRYRLTYTNFIPQSFPALLSFLSFQANRSNLIQEVNKSLVLPHHQVLGNSSNKVTKFMPKADSLERDLANFTLLFGMSEINPDPQSKAEEHFNDRDGAKI